MSDYRFSGKAEDPRYGEGAALRMPVHLHCLPNPIIQGCREGESAAKACSFGGVLDIRINARPGCCLDENARRPRKANDSDDGRQLPDPSTLGYTSEVAGVDLDAQGRVGSTRRRQLPPITSGGYGCAIVTPVRRVLLARGVTLPAASSANGFQIGRFDLVQKPLAEDFRFHGIAHTQRTDQVIGNIFDRE